MKMHRYAMTIAYDGTNYSGWQIQPHATSIQEIVLKAVQVIVQDPKVKIIGSGRTDAGVHASGQVAHFTLAKEIDCIRFLRSMNGLLPEDIRVFEVKKVSLDFHAQKSACAKIYHYHLYLDPVLLPFERKYVTQVKKKVDLTLLKEGAKYFVGVHDFSAFANSQTKGACAKNPVREIYSIDVIQTAHGVRLEFYGNGFLYKMVRNIVGILLDVATHERPLEDIPRVLEYKDRKRASKAAAPQGLFLVQVIYSI